MNFVLNTITREDEEQNDDWDNDDATVVCMMLGYSSGTALQANRPGQSGIPSKPHVCRKYKRNPVGLINCRHDGRTLKTVFIVKMFDRDVTVDLLKTNKTYDS